MWCPNCQADVAAEVSADNRRVRCAACSTDVLSVKSPPAEEKTKQARELLQRWASGDVLKPVGADEEFALGGPHHSAAFESAAPPASAETASKPVYRFDRPHTPAAASGQSTAASPEKSENAPLNISSPESARPQSAPAASEEPRPSPTDRPVAGMHVHAAHSDQPSRPHFYDVQSAIRLNATRKTNWMSIAGHILAYSGVIALTIGALYIVVGYFGGPDHYAPRGWFITTTGQMLLFLGVITLVSSGMEQTTDEVARRIDLLGERILRFEQASRGHSLRGPSLPAERFAEGQPNASPVRETSESR
jgi:hypothetical protein